jgi:CHASE2 domain-containing sensor protein
MYAQYQATPGGRGGAQIMNFLDWVQVALSLVVMLTGLYIVLFRRSRYGVLVTTRMASFGLALLGLSYFVGGFEHPVVGGPLADRIEAYSALVGILVVFGALIWQARGR